MIVVKLTGPLARRAACQHIQEAPEGFIARIGEPTRTLEQNALMWPLLTCFSEQIKWPVNGSSVHMTNDEWKDTLTAGFENETLRIAQGLNGGMVLLGRRTREYGKAKFSEFIEFMYAEGSRLGVIFEEVTV